MPVSIRVGAVFSTRESTQLPGSTSELWKSGRLIGILAANGSGILPLPLLPSFRPAVRRRSQRFRLARLPRILMRRSVPWPDCCDDARPVVSTGLEAGRTGGGHRVARPGSVMEQLWVRGVPPRSPRPTLPRRSLPLGGHPSPGRLKPLRPSSVLRRILARSPGPTGSRDRRGRLSLRSYVQERLEDETCVSRCPHAPGRLSGVLLEGCPERIGD